VSGLKRYKVAHETSYSYGGEVAHSHQLLHLAPRESVRQTVLERRIHLQPEPARRIDFVDAFGNLATRLEFDTPHDRLVVKAESQVAVSSYELPSEASLSWEATRQALAYVPHELPEEVVDACRFRMESAYAAVKQVFVDYADDCFMPDAPILEVGLSLMHKIHTDFTYAPGSTNIRTSALEALEVRQGVCQDFAHVMIACLRSRGLAARYVSGYLRTTPPANAGPNWVGSDASHAWVSVYCPPLGWIDLDPTNDVAVDNGHIVIAWGRDFGDVSPLRGIIVGGGQHRLAVRVSVTAE
jgi:transglutaminase-like putative cysteine protease